MEKDIQEKKNQTKGSGNTLINAMSFTLEKLKETLDSQPILGDKIELDGVTIIPVSKVSAGFAGGGANISDETRKKKQNPTGVGGSVTVTPLTFLVIDKDGVRLMNISEPASAKKDISGVASGIFSKVMEQVKNKKEEKKNKEEK